MQQIDTKIYTGKIKTSNGVFGFIESELGETFFHKKGLKSDFYPQKNDEIEFQIEPSKKKQGQIQACEIVLVKKRVDNEISADDENRLIGLVKWFDNGKGFGVIGTPEGVDYFLRKEDLQSKFISAGNIVVFYGKKINNKNKAIKCKHSFGYKDWKLAFSYTNKEDIIPVQFVERDEWDYREYTVTRNVSLISNAVTRILKQKNELNIQELCFFAVDLLQTNFAKNGYELVKEIVALNKINEKEKNIFLKSAFEKTNAEYQYKLFVDKLVFISEQEQSILLQRYLTILGNICDSNYVHFKDIAHSDKIAKPAKVTFIESAFENTNTEYQYKMLIDGLLILSEKKQIEFLKKYLFELGGINFSNYERIKNIGQSDQFEKKAKTIFLKSAIEKSNAEYHYKMLIEDNLMVIQNETSECQIELLQEYLTKIDIINIYSNWNVYDRNWKYNKIKFIAKSNLIERNAKDVLLKSAFEKSTEEYQYKMLFEDNLIFIQNETSQSQIELLNKFERLDLDKIKAISESDKLEETVKDAFLKSAFEKSTAECQYKMLFEDNLINIQNETSENQIELLSKFERLDLDKIKTISESDKLEETVKDAFLKSAFEKSTAECQYKMLFEDNLINIQNETSENQIELLSNFERLDLDKIKTISESDKLEETVKDAFLKSVFEKSNAECQYKMLFEDNLINIQNETSESQIELLSKFEKLDFDKIKTISHSDRLEKTVKDAFLKSAFEKSTTEIQYDMLFVNGLFKDIYFKVDFLINATQCGRMTFTKGTYAGETYFEVLERDIEYLHKNKSKSNLEIEKFYTIKHGYWNYSGGEKNQYYLSSEYKHWKEIWITILEDINNDIESKKIFSVDISNEDFFNKIAQIDDLRELFDIFRIDFNENDFKIGINKSIEQLSFDFLANIKNYKILACVKKHNPEFYNSLFEKNYPNISKIDRLYLWLNNLNSYYNYLELVQSAWQLSNDERKLLNKRIKEYAKDERLQKFYDQIPVAEIIDKTESTKTFKCKWRNLYYKNGSIQVFFDKTNSSEDYLWDSAREEWNLLTQEYFSNRRIDDIITTVNSYNQITKITGLEDIEVKIVIAEVRKNGTTDRKTNISASQISKIINNISARNQCINFLARQNSNYNVLDIQELVTDDYGSLRRDVSFIFPIPNAKGNVYLIWESAEFEKSKATHIFRCTEEEIEFMESKIKEFIESNLRTRSRLNKDLKVKKELQYFCRVNHDSVEYQVWENRMREDLPFLK